MKTVSKIPMNSNIMKALKQDKHDRAFS